MSDLSKNVYILPKFWNVILATIELLILVTNFPVVFEDFTTAVVLEMKHI